MNKEIAKEQGSMRIKLVGLQTDHPVLFKYPSMKVSITWDEKGEADVPILIGRRLLGPEFKNVGYEEIKNSKPEESESMKDEPVHKTTRSLKVAKTDE